ncbi:microfibril-associated glycoprotein 4-like [Clytia hemisphaerica]|uniref:microfibril-associated glycoprotein 4-like n=1 Tax=Clytia hemisphaerica TaxID=252671 RepID=UPI0034D4767B
MAISTILLRMMILSYLNQIDGKLLSKVAVNQIPTVDPIQVSVVERFPEKRCFVSCHFMPQCLSLLIEKFNQNDYQCRFYDKAHPSLKPYAGEATFYTTRLRKVSCKDWSDAGFNQTGVYSIYLRNGVSKNVWCNMDVLGGGWLVFQRRFDGVENFHRNWNDYKNGFGSVLDEHWLGNEILHLLTSQGRYEFYVHGSRFNNESKHSRWNYFEVESEANQYLLKSGAVKISGHNAMAVHWGCNFTTYDRDNDYHVTNCAVHYSRGAFWYSGGTSCGDLYLNGKYYHKEIAPYRKGIVWRDWITDRMSLKWTEMMIRKIDF